MRRLASLRPAHRVAFATACARRLAAAATCAEPAGESPVVVKTREFLDVLQSVAEGSESTVSDLPEALAACLALLPENEDDLDTEKELLEVDAASATAYALRVAISGTVEDAVWCARLAYEAADRRVQRSSDIDFSEDGAELRVLRDPRIQAELRRQNRDIDDLLRKTGSKQLADGLAGFFGRTTDEGKQLSS